MLHQEDLLVVHLESDDSTETTGKPPPSTRRQVHLMEEAGSASPSGSWLPPLEDRTQAQMIEDPEELPPVEREGEGSGVQFSQTFDSQRAFPDQGSIHIHNPEASLTGRMAETAASALVSEARAEATQVVSGIMTQAEQAVSSARIEVAQAQTRAEATHAVASHEINSLRSQLEIMRQENMELKTKFLEATAQRAQNSQASNGAEWFLDYAMKELESIVKDLRDSNVVPRVNSFESRIHALEQQLPPTKLFCKNFGWSERIPLFPRKLTLPCLPSGAIVQPCPVAPAAQISPVRTPVNFNLWEDDQGKGSEGSEAPWVDLGQDLEKMSL